MVFGPFHYCAFCERAAPDAVVSPKIARVFSELMWKAKLSAVDIAGGCMASNVGPLALQDPRHIGNAARETREKDAKKLGGSHQGHEGHRGNIKVVRT